MVKPNFVHVTGPESGGIDQWTGDEYPIWFVTLAFADSVTGDYEDIKTYRTRSLEKARSLGQEIGQDRGIQVLDESARA